ncbi:MAG: amidotransferase 1, exosortase A system-associated [Alphaproteobacteria bacterium]|nr:amidotransferase 1, exosortase A system-associated [Alphaproteobacteria bacterium]
MCGIAGIFDLRGRADVDRALLQQMTGLIAHRGPDGDGFHHAPGIGLGHRRLAIVDLVTGNQPQFNEDATVCVVFNGEIYNFQPLMAELTALGHIFRTRSDTEVIVHAWEEWGEACLDRFNGMFAFALWDASQEALFLARDRLGEKPLYYSVTGDGRLLFASELKSLALSPDIDRRLDPQAVEEFFAYGYIPDPRSIYLGVKKLAPAHSLVVRRGEPLPEPRCYWDVRFVDGTSIGRKEAEEELVARLRESVRMRMIADVPLGAFLSGGVDSSGVVAMMAGLQTGPVSTFSIAFGTKGWDESAYAAEIARRYRTDHHVREVDPNSFDLLDRLATIYDEPFGDSSAIPTFRVCAMARENVTVALSGDGGDEVFAGYRRYRWHCFEEQVRRLVPASWRRAFFGIAGALYPKLDWAPRPLRAKATLQELARETVEAYFSSVSICSTELRRRLFSRSLARELQEYDAVEVLRTHMRRCTSENPLSQVQYADFKTYLPGDILTKVDRASMASSLEVRVPLLDHTLVEWAARLPPHFKLHGREGKHVFKAALEPHVSSEILYRPKQGFAVPLAAWFRGPLRRRLRDTLLGPVLRDSGLFDTDTISTLLDQHESRERDHSAALWILSMMESFLRQAEVGGRFAQPAQETADVMV